MTGLRRILAQVMAQVPGIVGLAVPIVAGLAASTLLGVTDTLMLAPLGPVPLAAAGLAGAASLVLFAAVWGLLSAVSVRVGRARGAGARREIPGLIRNGLALGGLAGACGAAVMGLAWPLLPWLGQPDEVLAAMPAYWALIALTMVPFAVLTVFKSAFEAIGRPWLGTGFALLAVVVNVPLNWLLIWGPGPVPALGLTGAGIATLTAESLALAAAWAFWARARSMRRLRLHRPLTAAGIAATAREGAPVGAMYVAETAAMAVATLIIGTFGTVALAANQVAMSVGNLLYMVPLGVAGAVAIRVAQEDGAGRRDSLRPVAFAALGLATVWLSASALVLALCGTAIAGALVADPQVAALAAVILAVFAAMQVFDGVQSTMLGALRGLSDTAWPAAVSLVAYWAVGLPLAWVVAVGLGLGPGWVWTGWLVGLAGAGMALVFRFLRRTRGPSLPAGTAAV